LPWTRERALELKLWFGKHTGRTIGDLLNDSTGRSYLDWLAKARIKNASVAANIALGWREPDM
jgi:hypothetical protein